MSSGEKRLGWMSERLFFLPREPPHANRVRGLSCFREEGDAMASVGATVLPSGMWPVVGVIAGSSVAIALITALVVCVIALRAIDRCEPGEIPALVRELAALVGQFQGFWSRRR